VYEAETVDRVVHFRDGRIERTTSPPSPIRYEAEVASRGIYFPGARIEAHA
jgi:hypothetical protein